MLPSSPSVNSIYPDIQTNKKDIQIPAGEMSAGFFCVIGKFFVLPYIINGKPYRKRTRAFGIISAMLTALGARVSQAKRIVPIM